MPHKTIHGINLFYECKGRVDADEVIVFLNGVMASTTSWYHLIPFLENQYQIVLHDFRGQLKSDKPRGTYTFSKHAKDLKGLLEYLDLPSVHLIGTSYGGEVGLRFALDFPNMVKSLTIVNSVSEIDNTIKNKVLNWRNLAENKDGVRFFDGVINDIYHPSYQEKHKKEMNDRRKAMSLIRPEFFDGQISLYDTFLSDLNFTEELSKIKIPVLIIAGEEDSLKPPFFSNMIAQKIPFSEFIVVPNAAHGLVFEKPREMITLFVGFIEKLKLMK